jgi:tetratricopeptide (TPR) repeat protein
LKPENIIIQEHSNCLYAVISDFGFSSISHWDNALIQIPRSPPWTAPEHHVNKHSFEEAKQMDVFSWGLIMLWAILARVELSDLSYKAQLDYISTLKSDRKLIEKATSTLARLVSSPALDSDDHKLMGQLHRALECCLQHNPQLRAKKACEALSILQDPYEPLPMTAFSPQDEKDLSLPTHASFTIQKSISQLSTADYRVRWFILDELLGRTKHACDVCRELAKYESIVALKLGFGGHCISKVDIDSITFSASDDGTDPYCRNAAHTIRTIATSSSVELSLPPLDGVPIDSRTHEVHNLQDLVQADLVHEYQRRRDMDFAVTFYSREIETRTARFGRDHSLVLVLQNFLLLVYEACGNLFASQEISKAIYCSLNNSLGINNPSTLNAMAQYALQSVNAGQPGLAIALGEEIVERGAKVFSHADKTYVAAISNLGLAYFYQEFYAEAEMAFRVALEHQGAALGADQMEGSKIQMNLARAIKAQGDARLQEGEQLLVEASSQLEKNLGYLHRDTLSSLATRALSWFRAWGEYTHGSDVVQFQKNVIKMTKEFLGSQHPDTLVAMANYATSLSDAGSWVEAKPLYEEVLEALWHIPSDTHLQLVTVMAAFAIGCTKNGELDKAEELILQVLSTLKGRLSPLRPESDLARHATATLLTIYHLRGDEEKAEILLMVLWEGFKGGLGDAMADMNILKSVRNVAVSWLDRDYRVSEAHDLLSELLEITKRCNGPKHIETIVTRNELAESFRRQRQYSIAEKMHLETVKICRKEFGPTYPTTLLVMSNLAMIYNCQLKEEQASDLMHQLYLIEAERLGPSHSETVASAGWVASMRKSFGADHNLDMFPGIFDPHKKLEGTDRESIEAKLSLASAYEDLEYLDEALEIEQGVVRACKRRFGDTDLLTLRAWYLLAYTLHSAFEKSGSSSQLERAHDIAAFVFEEYNNIHGEYHDDTDGAETLLGAILRDQGLYDESERHLQHSLLAAEMFSGENVYWVIRGLMRLLKLYERQERQELARFITDRITNLKKEMDQNQTFHVNPEEHGLVAKAQAPSGFRIRSSKADA